MRYFICLLILLMTPFAMADELIIPFPCYPLNLQKLFLEQGRKLDLSGIDRTKDSWGFIENRGGEFKLFSYYSVTKEDFKMIDNIIKEME